MAKRWSLLATFGLLLALSASCGGGARPDDLFTEENAWRGAVPADAEVVTPEEFRRRVASGELQLVSSATIAAQRAARQEQYEDDRSFLRSVPAPSPDVRALLEEAASRPEYEGDRPVEIAGGQTVVLLGLGSQLRNATEAYERARSVENALADYTLGYALLSPDLAATLPTPDSLRDASLEEVRAAIGQLESALDGAPDLLGPARLEAGGGVQPHAAVQPGNGTDTDGPCSPANLASRYWFPLKNFISPVKNQASRGTCWAFTAVGALESRERVQSDDPVDLSEQFLVNKVKEDWDASDYTDGYSSERALDTAVDRGQPLPNESTWTYNGAVDRPAVTDGDSSSYANSCSGYTGTCSDTAHQSRRVCTTFVLTFCGYADVSFGGPGVASSRAIQLWRNGDSFDLNRYRLLLANGHALMAGFPVYKGFMDDVGADGVVSSYATTFLDADGTERSGSYGNHAVLIVGFLSNADLSLPGRPPATVGGGGYFIIKNSWGCFAGDGGFYYVPADYVSRLFNTLSVLEFDTRRSAAWTREQATPGGSTAPTVTLRSNPARVDLRVESDLAQFFTVAHPVAKSVRLTVTSDRDGRLYSGPWSTDRDALFGSTLEHAFPSEGVRTLDLLAEYGSGRAQAFLTVNAVNTPPALTLQAAGSPHQGESYPITALVVDINEPNAASLCASTLWSVDPPDTLATPSGCSQRVVFDATGSREVRVTTRDGEGAATSRTLAREVLPPPENPYPRVTSYGMYARDPHPSLGFCADFPVGGGSTIDLREKGCRDLVIAEPPQRYSAQVEVENPAGEALTYDWALFVTNAGDESRLYGTDGAAEPSFPLHPWGNAVDATDDCRVAVTVNAPDPARSKTLTVWTGRCTYYASRIN